MRVVEINDGNIDEILGIIKNKDQKVVAEFYADWCGHCKDLNSRVMPHVEEIVKKQPGKGMLIKVPEPMIQRMIMGGANAQVDGYPTIRLLQGGKKKKDYNGRREVKDLAKFIKKSLGKCRKASRKKTKRKKKKRKKKTRKNRRKSKSRKRFLNFIKLRQF